MEKEVEVVGEEEGAENWPPSKLAIYVLQHVLTPAEIREKGELLEKVTALFTNKPPNIMSCGVLQWEQYLDTNGLLTDLKPYATRDRVVGRIDPVITLIGDIPDKLRDKKRGMTPFAVLEKSFKRVQKYDMVFKDDENWCIEKALRPYFSPSGWRRYGFYPDIAGETEEDVENIMQNWHVAYHGTSSANIDSIVNNGLLPPGAVAPGGKEIKMERGDAGAKGRKVIYLSPSILYSSHWLYTSPTKYTDKDTGEEQYYYYVLQVRVKPGSFTVQGNTLWAGGWPDRKVVYDPRFGPDELEWVFDGKNANCIRVTGLMVKKSKLDPKEEVKQLFAKNKAVFDERMKAGGTGVWMYNSAPATGKTLSVEGPWSKYNEASNILIEKAYKSGQSVAFLGGIDTPLGQLRYYVDFEAMEQKRVDDATLRRLIKRV